MALMALCLGAWADGNAVKLILADGTAQYFLMDEEPSVRFADNVVIISSKTKEVSVSLENGAIAQIVFADAPTRIEETRATETPVFRLNGDGLEASGLKPGSNLCLYNLQGMLLARTTVGAEGTAHVSVSGKGVFIVKTSVSSFKIKK